MTYFSVDIDHCGVYFDHCAKFPGWYLETTVNLLRIYDGAISLRGEPRISPCLSVVCTLQTDCCLLCWVSIKLCGYVTSCSQCHHRRLKKLMTSHYPCNATLKNEQNVILFDCSFCTQTCLSSLSTHKEIFSRLKPFRNWCPKSHSGSKLSKLSQHFIFWR